MSISGSNASASELAQFGAIASRWWDAQGPFRPLHDLNPTRFAFVSERCQLHNAKVLDVGCGGGILSEALCKAGASVTGIDLAPEVIDVAKLHAMEAGLKIDYQLLAVEDLAAQQPASFDVITCMEMLEHVPDPVSVIAACHTLLKPGGQLFISTLNRTPKAFALAIVGAEYLLRLLPRGTHHYAQFIKPSELAAWLRSTGLSLKQVAGLSYDPFTRRSKITQNPDVNYLAWAEKH